MRLNRSLPFARPVPSPSRFIRRLYRRPLLRSFVVVALLSGLLLTPSPQLAREIVLSLSADMGSGAAKTVDLYTHLFSFVFRPARAAQAEETPETLADQLAYVWRT